MASLIESTATTTPSSADFKAATMDTAERLTSLLYGGYGDDGVANPQQSSLIALDDDLWRELYLLPTPPLSPDCLTSSPSPTATPTTQSVANDIAPGNGGLFVDMLGYDQMMNVLEEAERVLGDSQQSHQQDLLLQDCMWSGGHYDGLLLGSASTTGPTPATVNSTAASTATPVIDDESPLCNPNDTEPLSMDDSSHRNSDPDHDGPDCVEPSAVFPVLRTAVPPSESGKTSARLSNTSNQSHITSLSSSESEEEIDVVTVERSSIDQLSSNSDKSVSSITSSGRQSSKKQSIASRHSGSSSINTSIRKKRHTKKISRRSSEDGAESDEEARRASHNVLERKRRNDLKNSFDILRGGIPELEENLRAPKVVILRKAVDYIHGLQSTEQRTKLEFTKEQTRHKKLMEKLSLLRNSFCSV